MALGIALGIAKAGVGAFQIIQGNAAATQGARDAARFGQQIANTRFVNKFAALRAPTRGAELGLQNIARAGQMNIQAAKEGGLRGVIGAAGRTETAMTDAAAKIAAQLDDLQLKIDNKFLTEEQKTELRNKQKDLGLAYSRLQGAQAASTAGANQALAGLGLGLRGLGDITGGLIERSDLYKAENDGMSRRQMRKAENQEEKLQKRLDRKGITSGGAMEQARRENNIIGDDGTGRKAGDPIGADDQIKLPNTQDPNSLKPFQLDELPEPQLQIDMNDSQSGFTDPAIPQDNITLSLMPNDASGLKMPLPGPDSPYYLGSDAPASAFPTGVNPPTQPFNMPQDDPMMQFNMYQFDNAKRNADGLLVTPGLYM